MSNSNHGIRSFDDYEDNSSSNNMGNNLIIKDKTLFSKFKLMLMVTKKKLLTK